jgi:hypothetical protein
MSVLVGRSVGEKVGVCVGLCVGTSEVGTIREDGTSLGLIVGRCVGASDGVAEDGVSVLSKSIPGNGALVFVGCLA